MTNSNALRFAILGCGRMGEWHAKLLAADPRCRVVALTDTQPAAAERLRAQLPAGARCFPTLEALLSTGGIDAAVICTPTHQHFEQTIACLDHEISVLCEKPLADRRERILELIRRHRTGPAKVAVGYQRRSWGAIRKLRDELLSGRWGRVRAVASHNVEHWQPTIAGAWRDDPAVNWGGFIGDAGSHKIDTVFHVTGLAPIDLFARTDRCGSHVEITASVSAMLTGGVPLTMDFIGHAQYLGEDLQIHCEQADWLYRHGELWIGRNGSMERIMAIPADSSPVADFVSLLLGTGPEVAPPECALPVFDFTAAILRSSEQRRPVTIAQDS